MEVIKVLGKVSPSATILTTLYTVPTDKGTVVSFLNICNRDTLDATIRIAIYRTETPATADYLEYNMTVYGNCSAQRLKGVTMAQGDIVSIYASSQYISFQLFGSEFDQSFEYP